MKKRIITILSVLILLLSAMGLVGCDLFGNPVSNFNIYFNVDGEVIETITTNGNESIAIPDDPEKTGYEFDGWYWDKDVWSKPFTANSLLDAPISSNMSVYCKWKAIEYTASFYADNVFVDDAKFIIEDTIIKNVPNVPNKEGYTGKWDNYTIKAENIRIDAIYTINKYTVTWKNYDGAILETDYDVEYNATANYDGQMPTRDKDAEFTYTFNGWSPNVGAVKGDTIYTAQYSTTTNTYTVTWKNYDDTPLEIDNNVLYGTMPSFDGENPTKPTTKQYTFNFNGWDKTVDIVKGDIEYTALFNSITNKYSVMFYDEDGITELGKSTVNYGTNASYPNGTPLKEQDNGYTYTFSTWVTEKGGSIEDDLTNVIDNRSVYASYTPTARIYNVYFNENGGNQISDTTYTYGIGLSSLPTASDISRTGYTFDGWFIGEQQITEIGVTEYGDKTLTAKWTLIIYTASFYVDGQKIGTATFTVEDSEISGVPEVPNKVGYDKKWEDYKIIANDIDINAVYTPITYTITYLNTKNATNTNVTNYTIESDTLTLLDIFETGYTFDGWYDGDNKVTKIEKGSYGDKILTAKWTAIKYDLVLHFEEEQGHYAESASNPTYYTIEDEFDFVGLESNSIGRTFIGWFTSKNNGQGERVTDIKKGSIGKVELYAQWDLKEYSITYHNVNDAINLNATTYNIETETFTINELTLNGYDFIGWFSDEKLETPATTTITKGSNGDLSFYAKWKAIDYTITYELYGGEILNGTNPTTYTIEDKITFIEPTLADKTFVGWFTLAENGKQITGIEKGSVGNKTVYARYISFESNGGSDVSYTLQINDSKLVAPVNPTKDYYDFDCWCTDVGLTEEYDFSIPTKNLILYAKWVPTAYKINYVLNGGINDKDNPNTYTILDKIEIKNASKTGHTFMGWFTDELFTSVVVSQINKGTHGEITLYANYRINQYTISFESNGGTTVADIIQNYDTEVSAPENPAKNGYKFAGWYSDSGLTKAYTFNKMPAKNITLYAKWNLATYQIKYNLDGGTNSNSNKTSFTINSNDITLYDATKKGYNFAGWFTDNEFKSQITKIEKGSYGDKELFAKWEVITYTITYVVPDGTVNNNIKEYTVATDLTTLENATLSGYTFNGWFSDSEYKTLVITIAGGTLGNITLYGKFTANTYTVNLDGTDEATYEVSFNLNGAESTVPATQIVTETNKLKYPTIPTRTDYLFGGWYETEDCSGLAFDFSAVVRKDTVLYAKWVELGDNKPIAMNGKENVMLNGNNEIIYVFVPLVSGNVTITTTGNYDTYGALYNSVGVKLVQDDDTGVDSNFQIVYNVTANKPYYIHVRAYSSSITGTAVLSVAGNNTVLDGGYTVTASKTTVTFGEDFELTVPSAREGYKFLGFFDENDVQYAGVDGKSVKKWDKAENSILYTKWERTVYTITFVTNGGSSVEKATLAFGDRLDLNDYVTTRTGYSFKGWFLNASDTEPYNASTMPDYNLTLNAKWTSFALGEIKYNQDKKDISVNDTINGELFGIQCIDTDGNDATISVLNINGEQTAGNTITIIFKATSGNKTKQLTVSDVKVHGMPTITVTNTSKDYINENEFTASAWGASGKDTFGNSTTIKVYVDGEYKAGDIVTLNIDSIDKAGNITRERISNVKVYGKPVITYNTEKKEISVSDTLNAELFTATAVDSFAEPLTVSVTKYSGTISSGNTVTIRISATDSKGNIANIDVSCKVYGMPTISNATTTEFKVEDNITAESLGITAKDTFNNPLTIVLSSSDTQTAGNVMTITATVTDIAGNVKAKNYSVKIYGTPTITVERDSIKVTENPLNDVSFIKAVAKDSFGKELTINIELNNAYKDYVLTGGTTVKYDLAATDHFGNVAKITTNDIRVYDRNDIKLNYNAFLNDRIKLNSKGEEFEAFATDSFGENCDITIEPAAGYKIEGGKVINLYIVATDRVGNSVKSDLISDIKVYGMPTIVYREYIYPNETDLSNHFTVIDSFGEELSYTVTDIDERIVSKVVKIIVLAQDDAGNKLEKTIELPVYEYNQIYEKNSDGNSYSFKLYIGNATEITILSEIDNKPVTAILSNAFKDCSSLTSITIPNSVISIGGRAFYGCASLTSVYWNATNCTSAGSSTSPIFSGCSKLSTVIIGEDVKTIPSFAFYNCSSLTSVTIGEDVTSIGNYAFYGCSSITNIYYIGTIDEWVQIEGLSSLMNYGSSNKQFYINNELVTEAVITTATEIPSYAFEDCSSLTSVTIPDSVTSIGKGAFSGCSSIESITIPYVGAKAGVTSSNTYQYPLGYLFGTSSYTGGKETTQYFYGSSMSSTTSSTYYIPISLKKVTVLGGYIPYGAFYNCSNVQEIVLGNSVTSIGNYAFYYCSKLTSVTIGSSVTLIGEGAFRDCSSLTSVTIGNSVTSIGYDAFRYCSSLSKVNYTGTIDEWVQIEGLSSLMNYGSSNKQFYINNELVTEAEIKTATKINASAFYGCSSLTSVTIGNSVASIGSSAFYGCSSLTSVTIGNSVTSIGNYAFYYCSKLTSVTIGSSVTLIGERAFRDCSSLTSITIPDSVTSIGSYAFSGCSSLEEMSIPFVGSSKNATSASSSTLFGYIFGTSSYTGGTKTEQYYSGSSYSTYYIPSSLKSVTVTGGNILYGAFEYCSKLTSVMIGNSVTSIGSSAFEYCSKLTSVTIGSSVTSIGSSAFEYCSSLTSITIPDSVTSIGSSAFSGCSSLESMTIPFVGAKAGVTRNDTYQYPFGYLFGTSSYTGGKETTQYFYGSSMSSATSSTYYIPISLKKVTVLGGYIPYGAFYNCFNVQEIVLGESVSSIGFDAFRYCSSLSKVNYTGTIDQWVQISFSDYEANPLYYAKNLYINDKLVTEVVLETATKINDYAFYYCSSLTSVTIGNSVMSIGYMAFYNCSSLTSVTIPNSVTSIGNDAFYYCNSLTSIEIPNSVKSIGSSAFEDCSSLTSITIPDSVTSIGNSAFSGCSSLESITIPFVGGSKTATSSSNSTLFGYIFGTNSYTGGSKTDQYYSRYSYSTYYIPSSLKSVTVTGGNILYGAFYNCSNIKEIVLGDKVTSIGSSAFYNCSSLTSVTIPDSVTSIGDHAFSGCSSLTSITIPDSVTSIGYWAFSGCSSLTSITIPDSVTSIGYWAFSGCSSLTSITIPDSVTSIERYAFYNCSSLTSVTIPDSVTSIGDYAFEDCSSLTSITIPNSVKSIGDYAFHGCSSLTSITIPDSVTSIGNSAFSGCSSLEEMSIPFVGSSINATSESSSTLFGYIFGTSSYTGGTETQQYYSSSYSIMYYIPTSLKSVTVTGGNILYGAFYNCSSLTSVTIGNNVTSIGGRAFYGCSSLTSVTIGNNITSIAYDAFRYCSFLTSITIPESVTSIGSSAFWGCSSLTSVTIPESVTSIGSSAFYGCSSLQEITIPFVGGSKTATSASSSTLFGYIFGPYSYAGGTSTKQYYYGSSTSSTTYYYYIPSSLKSVTITGGNILYGAFYNCSSLTSVTIGRSVTSIDSAAFSGCYKLVEVINLSSLDIAKGSDDNGGIGYYALNIYKGDTPTKQWIDENGYIFYEDGNTCYLLGYTGKDSELTLPSSCHGKNYEIYKYAFSGRSSLTSVIIENSITSIGSHVFDGCYNLTSVTFKDTSTWYRTANFTDYQSKTGGSKTSVTSQSQNATYFTSTYCDYYWYKK